MYRFSDFPPQTIRDTIIEVLSTFGTPLGITELTEHVFSSLEVSEPIFVEHQSKVESISEDMVASGRLIKKDGAYNLGDIRKDGNEETYHVLTLSSPSENIISIKGSTIVETIGSEYYPEAWDAIVDDELFVELIPEPQNPYDNNAVAVTLNNQIIGHLTRSVASKYFNAIVKLNQAGYSIQVEGEVLKSPTDENYRFIQLAMPTVETINRSSLA